MPVDTPVDTPSHTPMDPPVDDASAYAALLGGFRLTVRGRPVTAWRAGKSQALFQYLVLHRDRPVHRDRLRAELWPHLVPPAGATSVKAAVHGVRRVLRPLARGAAPVELRLTRDGYLLTGDGLRTDVDDFLRAVRAGDTARHARDFDAAAEHYRRALREYRGTLLPAEDAPWVLDHRERLRSAALRAVRFLIERARGASDQWAVIEWSERALDIDPYDWMAYQELVEAYRQLGLSAQADRWNNLSELRMADV